MRLNFTFAPPSRLVTLFFLSGTVLYFISSILFFTIDFINLYYLDPKVVGFIHLFLLGFVMSIIFGAIYQLISVVLEVPLYSNQLAYTHLGLFLFSLIPFLNSFINSELFEFLGYGSMLLYLSFLLYLANIALSIKEVKKRDIKFYFIAVVHIILFFGVTYGVTASFGLVHQSLEYNSIDLTHKHIILTLFGFVGGLAAIMATILLPMFMLSHNFNKKLNNYILFGIISASISLIFGWFLISKTIIVATIFLFAFELYDIYKNRMRKHLDIYAYNIIITFISLILIALMLPFLYNEKILKLFMIFLLFGAINSFVVGHVYKIVPFLVWNEKFAPLVGVKEVPLLADMVNLRLSFLEFWTKIATIALLTTGLVLELNLIVIFGKILLFINGLFLILNITYIFRYKG